MDLRRWILPLGGTGALVLVFLLGLWGFFPWDGASNLILARLGLKAAEKGTVVSASSLEIEGAFAPRFTLRGLRVKTSFAEAHCREAALDLFPGGILLGAARASLTLDRGALILPDRQEARWSEGSARFEITPSDLTLADLRMGGGFSAEGSLILDLPEGKPRAWDLSLKVPDPLDRTMNMVQYLVPLKRTAPGTWRTQGP